MASGATAPAGTADILVEATVSATARSVVSFLAATTAFEVDTLTPGAAAAVGVVSVVVVGVVVVVIGGLVVGAVVGVAAVVVVSGVSSVSVVSSGAAVDGVTASGW